jgi:UPF0042 nucleotide-binding protein
MKLVIVSGLSGSGKSVALETLEDCDYYCIDNLPVTLLEGFLQQAVAPNQRAFRRTAISIDARSERASLDQFPHNLDLAKQLGIDCRILYLKAESDTLLKRFSETRRKHPLTGASLPLGEAIELERDILEPVCSRADVVIDTTHTNVRQLRDLVRARFDTDKKPLMSLYFLSFGFKHGVPLDADFLFDVRCLPNPYWEPALRTNTGRDAAVAAFLECSSDVREYLEDLTAFLQRWIPRFQAENRSYLTIAIGCTGGQHRSVYFAERLARELSAEFEGLRVRLDHAERARWPEPIAS